MKTFLGIALFGVTLPLCAQSVDTTQVRNGPVFYAESHNWLRTNGKNASGNLSSAGTKTITLTLCPPGLNFSVTSDQYVYISGGTGTPEYAQLVSGGTCSTGLMSGSIVVVTANVHSGAWSVGSSTDGIQEAINAAYSSRGSVILKSKASGYVIAKNGVKLWPYVTLACETPTSKYESNGTPADGCLIKHPDGAGTISVAAITAYTGSTIDGINFYNPSEPTASVATPTVFPPAIRLGPSGVGNNVTLRNLWTANAYTFIDATPYHGRLRVEHVHGQPIYRGIVIDGGQDMDVIRDVEFVSIWNDQSTPYAYPASLPNLQPWSLANGIGILVYVCDACVIDTIITNGYYAGIRLDGSGALGRSSYGTMTNVHSDSNRFALQSINNTGNRGTGWYVTNFTFGATDFYSPSAAAGALYCDNCIMTLSRGTLGVTATQTGSMVTLSGNARVKIDGVDAYQWSSTYFPVSLSGGAELIMSEATFWKYGASYSGHVSYQPGFTGPAFRCSNCVFDSIAFTEFDGAGTGVKSAVSGRDSNGDIQRNSSVGLDMSGGNAIASASTVTPNGSLVFITGTSAISTFTAPADGRPKMFCAVPSAAWSTNTAGNIAGNMTATVGAVHCWIWGGAKWYQVK